MTPKEVDGLKKLEDEIRHFKHITVSLEDISELKQKAQLVRDYPTRMENLRAQYGRISPGEYEQQSRKISQAEKFSHNGKCITIRYIDQHYYLPIVLSKDSKVDYIRHIIKTSSEVKFIRQLEEYLAQPDNKFREFDWWFFSKLDESLDEVYIPYYDPKTNRIARFKPDFIFWLCKDNRYRIAFVDPKGTEHVDYRRKIDGYSGVFLQDGQLHPLMWNGKTVTVHLFFYTDSMAKVPTLDRQFWCDYVGALPERLLGQS